MDNFKNHHHNFAPAIYVYPKVLKKNHYIIVFLVGLLIAGFSAHAQHPIGYTSLKSTSQAGSFSFSELDRAILVEKTAVFFAPEPQTLTFDVLVAANGDVKYVRAPRLAANLAELRLACTSALYGFAFQPVDATFGEKWFKATLVCSQD